jgi:hypothetical protein
MGRGRNGANRRGRISAARSTVNIGGRDITNLVTVSNNGRHAMVDVTDLQGAGVLGRRLPPTLTLNGRIFTFRGTNETNPREGGDMLSFIYEDGAGKTLEIVND